VDFGAASGFWAIATPKASAATALIAWKKSFGILSPV
jgi:hypothetical protein